MKSFPCPLRSFVAGALLVTFGLRTAHSATTVSGTLSPSGSLEMTAPATYLPGVPVLVRVDLKNAAGNLDRAAWNRTAALTATNGVVLTPNTVTLTNGMGSALVTIGGGSGGVTQDIFTYGVYPGTNGSTWKYRTDLTSATIGTIPATWKNEGFDDSTWPSGPTQIGYGDSPRDENTLVPVVDYNGAAAGMPVGPSYLFRNTFTITNVAQLASVTGQVKFDDACAVYVNGTEVYRTTPDLTANSPLTEYTETNTPTTRENATADLIVPLNLLHDGVNTIAVEVHQHDIDSTDVTFDLRLSASFSGTDPGNFSLTTSTGGISMTKALTSLGANPPMTNVAGTLPGSTTWSGVIHLTGDVTIPAGATLTIAPGTHVLVDGTPFSGGGSAGAKLNVAGVLNAAGTATLPISITCSSAANRWGEINFASATGTNLMTFCLVSRACHSEGGGHTGTGPMLRLAAATLTLEDSAFSDSPGKTMTTSRRGSEGGGNVAGSSITIRRTQFARGVMGPEVEAAGILIEDSNLTDMLAIYRHNPAAQDDEDCIYILDSGGRPVNARRSVFGICDDDAFDCLAGPINSVEDCIIRNAFDKGVSLLRNEATFRRTLIIDNDIGISGKSSDTTPRTIVLENCTIVGEEHPSNTSDGTAHSVGIHARNKPGQGNPEAQILFNLENCLIVAHEPFLHDAPYPPANTTATYTLTFDDNTPGAPAWPGTGNIAADPQFENFAAKDFRLAATSPARDTGDPASPLDPDGTRADMGALPFGTAGPNQGNEVRWTLVGNPYHVIGNTTVPANLTLRIDPGVAIQFDQNVQLIVRGRLFAEGTASSRIIFSHVPGAIAPGDADPIKNGVQTGPPKWGGVRIYDSLAQENVVRYCDFINAQGTSLSGSENYGSLGFIRSWGLVEFSTWSGTHLRMCYGRNPKLTVRRCIFPDMFVFDPALGREENPSDFLAAANNNQEQLKVEFPTGDPELAGNPNFTDGQPIGGWWRVYFNDFYANKGHNDVFDGDSGRWGQPGQLVLDCRYNYFHGPTGDEYIDLGGDAYVASNIFERGHKDQWGSDFRYSNAISSGDRGTGTTIMVARNLFFDVDHGINLSQNTATIFEHNTVANLHADFLFTIGAQTQTVECSVVNFFVPEDGANPTYGDGGYLGFNLISSVPHLFSGPDARKVGGVEVNDITTRIVFFHNLLDQIVDPVIGPNHPGGFYSGTYGPNTAGAPGFVDPENKNYTLQPGSPARGTAPGGLDYGFTVPEWAYLLGGPAPHSLSTSTSFTIGGPGLVAYKWRLNGGAWSAPIQIGAGGSFPRGATPAVRQGTLNLTGLSGGAQILEVLGQDMAGNWQDADPARTLEGIPQAAPTTRTWTIYTGAQLTSDNDNDGISALTELALGMNPTRTNGRDGQAGLPTLAKSPDGYLELRLQIPENSTAAQNHGLPEVIYSIEASNDLLSWTTIATKTANAAWSGTAEVSVGASLNGLVPITVRDVVLADRRFLRLVTTLAP